jgi:putative selenium metabolism hydrolase
MGSYPIDTDALVRFARHLAATPSVSGSEQAAVEATAAEFTELGFQDVHIDKVGNCVGFLGHGSGPRLLIDGHIDSIPLHSEASWTVDPFGGEIRDGRLYGLGICDQKASIAAAAHGLAAALRGRDSAGRVALVASINEESVEGVALARVVETFDPTWAVTTEPSNTRLCIGQRGRAKIAVAVTGRACHAGHPGQGVNAAEALAAMIVAVRETDHPRHPRLGRRDITCIDLASLPYPSVSTVPGYALARFDCRFLPGENPHTLVDVIRAAAARAWRGWPESPELEVSIVQAEFQTWKGARFSAAEFEPAWWTGEHTELVVAARQALASVGLDATPTHYSFCTNGSYLAGVRAIPTIGFGVGEEHIAHQVDEYVTLDSVRAGAAGYAAIATQLLGSSKA